jgi:hypothetical protein
MENNQSLLNADRKNRLGCYATFPGSGPHGSKCCNCAHQAAQGAQFICSKYSVLTGRRGAPIDPGSPACRYFSTRPAFNAAR